MARQTRHHAAATPSKDPDAGLPGPGQALVGYPQPQRSLFGVVQSADGETSRQLSPPRPRTSRDDHRSDQRRRRRSTQGHRRDWLQLLVLPLAILTLGVTLGVITVVMLIAAGVPVP